MKIRLLRFHFLNGIRKNPGSVIRLDAVSAKFLIERRIAEPVKEPKR
jgi:hypothetical protein